MIKNVFISFVIILLLLILPIKVHAHLGGGPPFLKVDGKDAQTNPYNQGAMLLTIPWDQAPDTYLVNTPIKFEINVPELLRATTVSEKLAKDIKIRWSVGRGDNFENKDTNYEEGATITKTFNEPGSYLVIIEAKLPADSEYILINTVQIDALPSKDYLVPEPYIYIGTQHDDPKKNVMLASSTTAEPSTKIKKYLWDFGESKLQEGASITRRFEDVNNFGIGTVFHRVIDENGFISDSGFVAEKREDKLFFDPFIGVKGVPFSVVTYDEAAQRAGKSTSFKLSITQFIGGSMVILFLLSGGWWWFLRKK